MKFYRGHKSGIFSVCISKDGSKVYTASLGEIFQWDAYSGHKRSFGAESKSHHGKSRINTLTISNNGEFLYSADFYGKILKWELEDLQLCSEICCGDPPSSFGRPKYGSVNTMCTMNGNDQILFSAGASQTIVEWNLAETNLVKQDMFDTKHTAAIRCICATEDSKYIISASDRTPQNQQAMTIIMWSIKGRSFLKFFSGYSGPSTVRDLCIINDELYSCAEPGDISVWNIDTGKQIKFLQATEYDLPVNLTENVPESLKEKFNSSEKEAYVLCLLERGKYLICGRRDGTIDLFDMTTNTRLYTYKGHTNSAYNAVNGLCVAPRGRFFSVSDDNSMIQWDLITDSKPLECHADTNIQCTALSRDSTHLYSDCNGAIVAWDLRNVDKLLHNGIGNREVPVYKSITSKESKRPIGGVFCISDKFCFRAVEDRIYRWSLPDLSNPISFNALDKDVKCLCLSQNGDFLYSSGSQPEEYGKAIVKWRTEDNCVVLKLKTDSSIRAMSLLEVGDVTGKPVSVLFSANKKVVVYDVELGLELDLELDLEVDIGFGGPDGNFHSICSWAGVNNETETPKTKIHVFAGNNKREIYHWTSECESFAKTGLLSQEWRQEKTLVDMTSLQNAGEVQAMCVSPDGKHLFSSCKEPQAQGSEPHFVYIWDIYEQHIIVKLPFEDNITSMKYDERNDCLVVSVGTVIHMVPYMNQICTRNSIPTWLLNNYLNLDIEHFDPDRQCTLVSTLIKTPESCAVGNNSFFLGLLEKGQINAVKKCFIDVPSKFPASTVPFHQMVKAMIKSPSDTRDCEWLILKQVGASVENYNGVKLRTKTPQLMFNTFDSIVDNGSFVKNLCNPRISDELLLCTLQRLPLIHLEHHFLPRGSGYISYCSPNMMETFKPASRRKGIWCIFGSSVTPDEYDQTTEDTPTGDLYSFEHCVTPFEGFADIGKDSFLQRILKCKGDARSQVFGTNIATSVVNFKWETVARRQHYFELVFYTASLSIAVALTFVKDTLVLRTLYGILLAYASMEMLDHLCLNFDSIFTFIRLITTSLTLAVPICYFFADNGLLVDNLKALMTYFRWIGLCYYLQPFPKIGPVVQMIIVILYEILDILLVALVLILGLSNGILILLHSESNSEGFSDPIVAIYTTYKMILLGDFDDSEFAVGQFSTTISVIFVVSSLLGIIVILNLIIARMSDAYERIQEEAEMEHRRLQAQIIVKHEFFAGFLFRKQSNKRKHWLHVVQPTGLNNPIVKQSWSGVFHSLKQNLKDVEKNLREELKLTNKLFEGKLN